MSLVLSGHSPLGNAGREGSPEAQTPGQPLPASIRPPATSRATLQSKAIQEEGWSPARHAMTHSATQDHPRAPTQPARTCSGAAHPASTQGHPRFSWVPLPSAVPRGTRSLPLGPSSILSFQPHLTWASPTSPSPEDNQSEETHLPAVGTLETVLGTSGGSDPSTLCIAPAGNSPTELWFLQKVPRNGRKPEQTACYPTLIPPPVSVGREPSLLQPVPRTQLNMPQASESGAVATHGHAVFGTRLTQHGCLSLNQLL